MSKQGSKLNIQKMQKKSNRKTHFASDTSGGASTRMKPEKVHDDGKKKRNQKERRKQQRQLKRLLQED